MPSTLNSIVSITDVRKKSDAYCRSTRHQHRHSRQLQHLGHGGAQQQVARGAHAPAADEDHVAALGLGVGDDDLGRRPDQHPRLVVDAGVLEHLLRLGQLGLALFLVVLLQLRLADELRQPRQARHRRVHRHQLDRRGDAVGSPMITT